MFFESFFVLCVDILVFFFFQAEDGIRDRDVTGVQTCALPICEHQRGADGEHEVARRDQRLDVGLDAEGDVPEQDRKSVVWGKSVDLGGRRIMKKKKKKRSQ